MTNKLLLATVLVAISVPFSNDLRAQEKTTDQKKEAKRSGEVTSTRYQESNESLINYSDNDHQYKMKLDGRKILELYVDGNKIPPDQYSGYDNVIEKILAQIEKDRKQAEKDRQRAEVDRQRAEKDFERATLDRKRAEEDRLRADEDRLRADEDRARADDHRAQGEKDRERANEDRKQAELDRGRAEVDRKRAEKDRAKAEIDRRHAEEDRKMIKSLVGDIVENKLVENESALRSFSLDEHEFIVNGTRQSEKLQKQFGSKYLNATKTRIRYKHSDDSTLISVD